MPRGGDLDFSKRFQRLAALGVDRIAGEIERGAAFRTVRTAHAAGEVELVGALVTADVLFRRERGAADGGFGGPGRCRGPGPRVVGLAKTRAQRAQDARHAGLNR